MQILLCAWRARRSKRLKCICTCVEILIQLFPVLRIHWLHCIFRQTVLLKEAETI